MSNGFTKGEWVYDWGSKLDGTVMEWIVGPTDEAGFTIDTKIEVKNDHENSEAHAELTVAAFNASTTLATQGYDALECQKALPELVARLQAIRDYPEEGAQRRTDDGYPQEVIYDKFAYRRIVDSYREIAATILTRLRVQEVNNG